MKLGSLRAGRSRRWLSNRMRRGLLLAGMVLALSGAPLWAAELVDSETLVRLLTPQGERGLKSVGVLGPTVSLSTIQFKFDSAELTPEAVEQLDHLGAALGSNDLDRYGFLLVGHTDSTGSRIYNQALSERRAARVRSYLEDKFQIRSARLESLGMGERSLLIDDDPENPENRRVEVHNMGGGSLRVTRGTAAADAIASTNSISSATSLFCVEKGVVPEFYVLDAPTSDERIVVRRTMRPKQIMHATWPANASSLAWPQDWPPPEKGRYIWALGYRGTSTLEIVELGEELPTAHDKAAAFEREGCYAQVRAAFHEILAAGRSE